MMIKWNNQNIFLRYISPISIWSHQHKGAQWPAFYLYLSLHFSKSLSSLKAIFSHVYFEPVFLIFLLFWVRVSLYSPGWPWTCNSLASAFRELGLQVWATIPGLIQFQLCKRAVEKKHTIWSCNIFCSCSP
jgi:hypothetical protein